MLTQTAAFPGTLLLATVMEPKEIGERLKAAREGQQLSQLEFAIKANVSPSTVSRWERGFLPRVRELSRVAEMLGLDAEQLVQLTPTEDDRYARLERRVEVADAKLDRILDLLEAPAPPVPAKRRRSG